MRWVPPGFAHGVLTLTDIAEITYKVTAEYSPSCDRSICWSDPVIGIFFRNLVRDLVRQPLRTILTLSGVVWGTFSVVLLIAFGDSVSKAQIKRFHGMGQGIILDPFMGSGSTIAAAAACGLSSIGLEVNPAAQVYALPIFAGFLGADAAAVALTAAPRAAITRWRVSFSCPA
jgi:hypothetical protein